MDSIIFVGIHFRKLKKNGKSWLSLNAVEVKQTSHLLDVCRFRWFLWQFDGFFRNTCMPLHDHPYSDVNIIYSVVQMGERTKDQGTNSIKFCLDFFITSHSIHVVLIVF
jgi:hypothetical protein